MVGKSGTKAVLLVLTERKTRYELIFKLEGKTEKAVVDTLDKLERKPGKKRFRRIFKTITCDNGCENLDHEGMERSIREIKRIERWMNDYPRAILGGLSARLEVLALGQEPIRT